MARTKKPENKIITYGCKKSAIAVAVCTSDASGAASIRVNGVPLKLVGPPILRTKILEPILLLGLSPFKKVKIRIRVRGGGQTSQIYAIRQAICKALIAYEQKYGDELTWLDMRQKVRFVLIQLGHSRHHALISLCLFSSASFLRSTHTSPSTPASGIRQDSPHCRSKNS